MGQIRRVVPFLDISDPRQRLLGRKGLLGSHRGEQQERLPEGQRRRPFFTRARARTRKCWAKRHRVICCCQPSQLRTS